MEGKILFVSFLRDKKIGMTAGITWIKMPII